MPVLHLAEVTVLPVDILSCRRLPLQAVLYSSSRVVERGRDVLALDLDDAACSWPCRFLGLCWLADARHQAMRPTSGHRSAILERHRLAFADGLLALRMEYLWVTLGLREEVHAIRLPLLRWFDARVLRRGRDDEVTRLDEALGFEMVIELSWLLLDLRLRELALREARLLLLLSPCFINCLDHG